jgi:hypothetical protein
MNTQLTNYNNNESFESYIIYFNTIAFLSLLSYVYYKNQQVKLLYNKIEELEIKIMNKIIAPLDNVDKQLYKIDGDVDKLHDKINARMNCLDDDLYQIKIKMSDITYSIIELKCDHNTMITNNLRQKYKLDDSDWHT